MTILKFLPSGLLTILLLNTFSTVVSEDLFINPWELRAPNLPYEDLNVAAGDTITFIWERDENHTVYINPTGTCNDEGAILIGDSSPTNYTFTQSDAQSTAAGSPVYFTDNIDQLCEWGMRFEVSVFSETSSPSSVPTDLPTATKTLPPSLAPSSKPTVTASMSPTSMPSESPVATPSNSPTVSSSDSPSTTPTITASGAPSTSPTIAASEIPSDGPSMAPSLTATGSPSVTPSSTPSITASSTPSITASSTPSITPSSTPSITPSSTPSISPSTSAPSGSPSKTPTTPPVPFPTSPPTPRPTANPTANPTVSPTVSPTVAPTVEITAEPTIFPTRAPVAVGERVSETFFGLRMGMAGVSDLTPNAIIEWQALTEEYSTSFVFNDLKDSVTNYVTSIEVTDFAPYDPSRRMMRGDSRNLQDQSDIIVVEYTQTVIYNIVGSVAQITAEAIVAAPFATDTERGAYVTVLKTSDNEVLSGVKGVSEVQVPAQPTPAPTPAPKSDGLSKTAIIGISCGGAASLIIVVLCLIYCRGTGEDDEEEKERDPPLHVDVRNDEVSTLAGPDGPPTYGDQSIATVDYDYSKAYGGAGDTSVSSAGGTLGSQTQNISLPANAAATGAMLGSMDSGSYEGSYSPRSSAGTEEIIHIFAPPGKLGVVIDTPDDGAPVVHAVKDTSVIADRIIVGDKLVAVDDEDVRSMTAIKVSKMISRKGANPSRKLTIVRTVPIGE